MVRMISLFVVLFGLAVPGLAAPASPLAQVEQHLRAITTMTADFTQINPQGKTVTGTLTLKQPGRIRFQYAPGVPLLIVSDGKALTLIDYQVRQVSRWPIGGSPLAVLLDPSVFARYAHLAPGSEPGRLLVEGRDPKHPEFGTITIGLARTSSGPGGLMLAGWTVLDAQGNRSSVVLSNQTFGASVSDKTFLWRDPRPTARGH